MSRVQHAVNVFVGAVITVTYVAVATVVVFLSVKHLPWYGCCLEAIVVALFFARNKEKRNFRQLHAHQHGMCVACWERPGSIPVDGAGYICSSCSRYIYGNAFDVDDWEFLPEASIERTKTILN
ncbi:MAG: hypothetical protein QG620_657 [Patescibacteria group bacterium]|nr:hypothetical protein [Patescibacteria group bacterium]